MYECPHCHHRFEDADSLRRHLEEARQHTAGRARPEGAAVTPDRLSKQVRVLVVGVLAPLLIFAFGFVTGGVYVVQKHEDKYCPDPPSAGTSAVYYAPDGQKIVGVRTGCRDGETLFD